MRRNLFNIVFGPEHRKSAYLDLFHTVHITMKMFRVCVVWWSVGLMVVWWSKRPAYESWRSKRDDVDNKTEIQFPTVDRRYSRIGIIGQTTTTTTAILSYSFCKFNSDLTVPWYLSMMHTRVPRPKTWNVSIRTYKKKKKKRNISRLRATVSRRYT